MVHEVKDSDNIKQDMSIDVYGRSEEDNKSNDEIESLYNVWGGSLMSKVPLVKKIEKIFCCDIWDTRISLTLFR